MIEEARKHWQITQWVKQGERVALPRGVDYAFRIKDDVTYIYCYETQTKSDVIANMQILPTYHLGALYHTGYFKTALTIMDDLDMRKVNTDRVKLYGYSLGGSVSSIINDIYRQRGTAVIEHVTFSELASGIGFKLKNLRKSTIRYVQFVDLMIYIQFLYKHQTPMTKLPTRGSFKENHLYYHLS